MLRPDKGLGSGIDKLGSRVDDLAQRVGRLSHQLTQETATTRLARWVSRHPPKSGFVRQIGDGNTGRCATSYADLSYRPLDTHITAYNGAYCPVCWCAQCP
jgi:hypothetical protein